MSYLRVFNKNAQLPSQSTCVEMPTSPRVCTSHHPIMPDSDSLYHRLFSEPRMVEGLVREFVPPELTVGRDFCGLRRVNTKFHPGRLSAQRREADVIWRLPIREGKADCLHLLIEFQGTSDEWMPVRTQVYQGLLWQQVIAERRLQSDARLPPLLLLVLYNGELRWKAATETSKLIALSPDSSLWPWQPQSRYCLLDMGAFPKDELARRSSLVALLFRLEQRNSREEFKEVVDEVRDWFRKHEGCERLRGLFTELIRKACDKCGLSLPASGNLLEEKTMLSETFEAWQREWLAEGEAKGEARGEARGEAKGKAEALISLLAGRFGAVDLSCRKRIEEADLVTLDRWFERAIVAPDPSSVFRGAVLAETYTKSQGGDPSTLD
jgi:hypothetical protein